MIQLQLAPAVSAPLASAPKLPVMEGASSFALAMGSIAALPSGIVSPVADALQDVAGGGKDLPDAVDHGDDADGEGALAAFAWIATPHIAPPQQQQGMPDKLPGLTPDAPPPADAPPQGLAKAARADGEAATLHAAPPAAAASRLPNGAETAPAPKRLPGSGPDLAIADAAPAAPLGPVRPAAPARPAISAAPIASAAAAAPAPSINPSGGAAAGASVPLPPPAPGTEAVPADVVAVARDAMPRATNGLELKSAADRRAPPEPSSAAAPPPMLPPMSGVVAVTAPAATGQPLLDTGDAEWMQQMIEHIDVLRDGAGRRDARIRLAPEALGSLDLSLREDEQGLHVRFSAEHAATRALLQDAAPRLAELAEARGLRLSQSLTGGEENGTGGRPPGNGAHDPAAFAPRRPPSAEAADASVAATADQRIA